MTDLIFGLKISAIGIVVVFCALMLISWIVSLLRLLEIDPSKKPVVDDSRSDELTPELIAVISAAVAVAINKRIHIKRIRYRNFPIETAWYRQGRASVMASHSTKRGFNQ